MRTPLARLLRSAIAFCSEVPRPAADGSHELFQASQRRPQRPRRFLLEPAPPDGTNDATDKNVFSCPDT